MAADTQGGTGRRPSATIEFEVDDVESAAQESAVRLLGEAVEQAPGSGPDGLGACFTPATG